MNTVRGLLHAEGLAVFVGAIALYANQGFNGWVFLALLLIFDLSMVGYWVNLQVGAWAYNAAHTYLAPLTLIALSQITDQSVLLQFGLVWMAHIGMDRTVGYGLKYPSAFKDTHLQRV